MKTWARPNHSPAEHCTHDLVMGHVIKSALASTPVFRSFCSCTLTYDDGQAKRLVEARAS